MSQEALDLLKKALELPVGERAELAGSLIESLEDTEDESVQEAWDAEVVRRMEDLNSGKVKPISLEEAKRKLSSAIEWPRHRFIFILPRSMKQRMQRAGIGNEVFELRNDL